MKIELGLSKITPCIAASFCRGEVLGECGEIAAKMVCTDSREADADTLFVATRGERVDGHDYIASAIERGCRMILCERVPEGLEESGAAFVVVKDSIEAFSHLARGYRAERPLYTVAITGSVGKTTTKELTAAIFRRESALFATEGNFNSVIGMPMSLMSVGEDKDTAIFEMGMSGFCEISAMTRAATPNIAMVINVGSSHLEYLKTRDNIARAKLEIAEGLRVGGTLLLNGDEPLLLKHARGGEYKIIYVGHGDNCDIQIKNVKVSDSGTEFDLDFMGRSLCSLKINLIGAQFATNAAFAAAAGILSGISESAIREGLAEYIPGAMRQNITKREGITVIADCYNAAPESTRAAIDTLASLTTEGKRIAVLGDMRELGCQSEKMHREIGEYVYARGIDLLFTLGASGEHIANGAKSAGMSAERVCSVGDTEMIDTLCARISEKMSVGDAILFKASRGVRLERAIEGLFGENK